MSDIKVIHAPTVESLVAALKGLRCAKGAWMVERAVADRSYATIMVYNKDGRHIADIHNK
jgi:hypothetical protein